MAYLESEHPTFFKDLYKKITTRNPKRVLGFWVQVGGSRGLRLRFILKAEGVFCFLPFSVRVL